jgi:hypothetical protein
MPCTLDARDAEWKIRYQQVRNLSMDTRRRLLKAHPVLAARMFHLKQICLWNYIMLGKNRPLGEIVDFWRRIEVS